MSASHRTLAASRCSDRSGERDRDGRSGLMAGAQAWGVTLLLALGLGSAHAQVAVSEGGMPTYSQAIPVPPGVAGMAPKLGLVYAGGGVSGPVGHGWSVQGLSTITRCAATRAIDGTKGSITYTAADKLCLDGQRLIQTDAAGTPLAFPQSSDALGLGSGYREFRTERDSYARVRAYGYANGDTSGAGGPAYFKVWTKSGQVNEYGATPVADANTQALIAAQGKTVAMAWAVARISDTLGNFIDFKYEQRDVAWGSGTVAGSPTLGHEWNIAEIQYSGNKLIFNYVDRVATTPQDAAEAYHQGSKNVSMRLLKSITTYVNSPNPGALGPGAAAVPVKTVKLGYDNGPISGRSRVTSIQECVGSASSTRCLPASSFTYAPGGNDAYQLNTTFTSDALATLDMQNASGTTGVLVGDFNGDGRTDILRWSDDPAQNKLFLSNGNGSFSQVPNGSGAGQFNITSQNLFKSDGCYVSYVADFNGDGLPDILRYAATASPSGAPCASPGTTYLYINGGNGSFTANPIVGVSLQRTLSARSYSCSVNGRTVCTNTWTAGSNFYLIDFNGDGKLDVVTAAIPPGKFTATNGMVGATSFTGTCPASTCTRVYQGDGLGNFTEVAPGSMASKIMFVNPTSAYTLGEPSHVVDLDGDGLPDLVALLNATKGYSGASAWHSNGDGTFVAMASTTPCGYPIDFNGDGRADCLVPTGYENSGSTANQLMLSSGAVPLPTVADFNLTATNLSGAGYGMATADVNGDGRHDILHWEDNAANNALYLSNGNGTFTPSTTFNLGGASAVQLQKSDGTAGFVVGDFTGRGNTEILRLQNVGGTITNRLYVKVDSTPPDQLRTATNAGGVKTNLYYVPLANATPFNGVSGSYGSRYASDRGTANAASGSKLDLTIPMYVVATSVTDSGVGAATVASEYSYAGLKADTNGRGMLGFREVHRQSPGANGDSLSVFTKYLQDQPYIGTASRSETRYGTVNNTGAQLLASTSYIYCDQTVPGAEASATESAPCPTSAKVQRPYLRQSVENGTDLSGAALPQTTTTNTYNGSGDPSTIVVTSTGSVAGIGQTFTRTTSNLYQPDDTSCASDTTCNWIRGRLSRASVQSTVPNSLASIATGAGSNPNASATSGSGPTQFAAMSPSVSFGSVTVGSSSTQSATLTNTGPGSLSITVPTASSVTGTDFSFVSTSCTSSLAPGGNCAINVAFTPTANTARSGTLSVSTGAGSVSASLSGTGTGGAAKLTFSYPGGTAVAWGNQQTGGTYGSSTATLTNTGNVSATAVSLASSAPWSLVNNTCGATLAVNASCTFSINFSPTAAQAYSGSVSATTSSGTATNSLTLTGTGTAPSLAKTTADNFSYNTPANTGSGHFIGIQNNGYGPVTVNGLSYSTASGNFNAWMAGSGSGNPGGGYCWPGAVLQPGWSCGAWANADTGSGTATFNTSAGNITYTGSFTSKALSYSATTGATAPATSGQTPTLYTLTISNATPFTYYFPRFGSTGAPSSIGRFTGGNAGNFVITATSCGASMAPNTSCSVSIAASGIASAGVYSSSFQPNGTYQQSGDGNNGTWAGVPNWLVNMGTSLADVYVSATNPVNVTATATVATLTSAAAQTFPATWYGAAAQTLTYTYRNDGNVPMTLAAPALAAPLSVTSNSCSNVGVGLSCSMVVTESTNVPGIGQSQSFTPAGAATGPATATATWTVYSAVPRWSTTSLNFGSVTVGSSSSQTITLYNDGNVAYNWAANSTIANAPAGYSFNTGACTNVTPGGSCSVTVTFTPPGAATYSGSGITMSAASYNSNTFSVTGAGLSVPSISASTGTIASTTVWPTAASGTVSFTNNGQTPTTLTLSATGGSSLSTTVLNCPASGSCGSVTVTSPASIGSYNGSLTMTSSAGGSVTSVALNLSVTGSVATLTSSTALNFGSVSIGAPAPQQSWSFRNDGNAAMSLSLSALNSPFGLVSNGCSGIGPGGVCSITASMATSTANSFSQSNIAVSGAAQGNRSDLSASGTVVSAVLFTVTGPSTNTWTFTNPNSFAVTPTVVGLTGTGPYVDFTNVNATGTTCSTSSAVPAGGTCTVQVTAQTPDCKLDNYTVRAFVTTAAGTTTGTSLVKSTSNTICP